jgi:hypothetical protein
MKKTIKVGDRLRVEVTTKGRTETMNGHLFGVNHSKIGFVSTDATDEIENWRVFGSIIPVNDFNNISYNELNEMLSLDKNKAFYFEDNGYELKAIKNTNVKLTIGSVVRFYPIGESYTYRIGRIVRTTIGGNNLIFLVNGDDEPMGKQITPSSLLDISKKEFCRLTDIEETDLCRFEIEGKNNVWTPLTEVYPHQ